MTKTTGSILLVDDEAKIREALARALREDGHEVVATGCPRDAALSFASCSNARYHSNPVCSASGR